MSPADKFIEMFEELLPEDQEKAIEYMELLRSEHDAEYRTYVLEKIARADAAAAKGEHLNVAAARNKLLAILDH
jgi:hypothetical protein